MTNMSKTASWVLFVLAAIALTGCFQIKAPESIDIDLGNRSAHAGDRRPAPTGDADEALRRENQALRDQLADVRSELKAARGKIDDLQDDLEDLQEKLEKAREDRDDD